MSRAPFFPILPLRIGAKAINPSLRDRVVPIIVTPALTAYAAERSMDVFELTQYSQRPWLAALRNITP